MKARKRAKRATFSKRIIYYCDECENFSSEEKFDYDDVTRFDIKPPYKELCRCGHPIRFRMPRYYNDDIYGFYRTGCRSFKPKKELL